MIAVELDHARARVVERPDPVPAEGQVLVRMRAAGLNISDKLGGTYVAEPLPPGWIPGFELSGERLDTREAVLGIVEGGAHAELVAVDARHLVPLPPGVDPAVAGGFMEAFTTAHRALVTVGALRKGERVLVAGAAAAVGLAAVQLADALGAAVIADIPGLTRAPEHADDLEHYAGKLRELGAAEVVVPGEAEGPFDLILHVIGDLGQTISQVARHGRIVLANTEAVTSAAGPVQALDLGILMRRAATLRTVLPRALTPDEKADAVAALAREVLPLLATGQVGMPIDSTFPLSEAPAAFARHVEAGKWGKVVLTAKEDE
jgi:NADPH:quinone reductase-like Zn-dependent oxidoreductase